MDAVRVVWIRDDDVAVADRVALALVREAYGVAGEHLGLSRLCPRCASTRHGRPQVLGLPGRRPGVSIARSVGVTVVAVSEGGELGVDVERTDLFAGHDVAAVALHPDERVTTPEELAATWVRKEALLKAAGRGLSVDPASIRIEERNGGPVVTDWPSSIGRPGWLLDLALAPDLTASLAGSGRPGPVTLRQAGPGALRG